jgi:ABC-type transport system involved in multi-copper enzyme maturation permease subunit
MSINSPAERGCFVVDSLLMLLLLLGWGVFVIVDPFVVVLISCFADSCLVFVVLLALALLVATALRALGWT